MTSTTLLSSRLLSLFKNGQWKKEDVVKLFTALLKEFNDTNEDFYTWMKKILYKVEIHKIRASDLTLPNNDQFVDCASRIDEIIKNNEEKTLDEIMKEISEQKVIDERVMTEVKDIVLSVSECLSSSTAPHLQGIKDILFKLCKAVEKTMKMKPRLTQMVSWCFLVLSQSSQLVQVGTGEGKSCIVAMFAAYQAMIGKTPDIISSSPVLAERDADEWSPFYKEMSITVGVNTNKTKDSDLKKCYDCKVVYGTTESFAGDYLRQHFHRKDVRPKREFQCVIVDEVDSLMLDKGLEVVYLSTDVPLMESLNGILAEIWYIVNQLKHLDTGEILGPIQHLSQILSERIFENDNIDQLKVVQAAVNAGILPTTSSIQKQEDVKNVLKQLDNASDAQMVDFLMLFVRNFPEYDFKLYLQEPDGQIRKLNEISTSSVNIRQVSLVLLGCGQCRVVHLEEELMVASLVESLKKVYLTALKKEQNVPCIPGLRDLIDGKLQTWIENALEAQKMTLGHEYILYEDGVVPVDYSCTGVVQNNMKWGEGLQQFLEMKHQTKLSNMTLITNFMSYVGLFKKYNNIYGITGTLGDPTELDMLEELYKGIKTCKIPSFRRRKLYELEGLVIPEEKDWIRNICNVVKEQVYSTDYRGPRAALVICETINRAEMLYKDLDGTILKGKLKLYINNNMDNSTIVDKAVQPGDVIIATNLAGRGTDLKVCKSVNEAGGLFVVQTFLPLNVRVEQQAFGRTARKGSPGSAQLIVCCSHFSNFVKLMMTMVLNTSLASFCLGYLDTFTCGFTESLFESAVNLYKENPSSQNHEIMVSVLTTLLNLESFTLVKSNLDRAKEARNIVVKIRLSRFLKEEIPQITKKEELFSVYLEILDKIYENDCFSEERDVIVSSLHECWGPWLLMNFSEEKSIDKLKEQLKVDLQSAKEKLLRKESPSSMVYYYIRSGNKLRQNGHIAESIEMYTKAVEDGDYGEIIPQYNRALAIITKKDPGYIAQALTDLENADKAINSYKLHMRYILNLVKLSSQDSKAEDETLLTKQFQVKAVVLDLLKTNIQDAVMKLKSAERSGREIKLTTKHALFLIEHISVCYPNTTLLIEHMLDCSLTLLIEHMSVCSPTAAPLIEKLIRSQTFLKENLCSPNTTLLIEMLICFLTHLIELSIEIDHIISLGLDTVFSMETLFSFREYLSRFFR
ncbi:protein translocase subunit SecA-like [Paramisgurnus dabryanus]|uniref:protein translocase subunit SecA-like n=1 Tax=Paramisgurnus dabryanus TaxID=90735 RepID=UPI0031F3A8D6